MSEKIQQIEDSLKNNIDDFSHRRKRMFNAVRLFKYSLVILAATSTVVLGLDLGGDNVVYQKNIGLIIGAIITALTILMSFWNVEEYWLQSKIIELQLKSLKEEFTFYNDGNMTDEDIEKYFIKFQNIVGQKQTIWESALSDKTKQRSRT